ncbi:MAG TPA: ABC transporter permease [Gemmatimonadales bacterium]|nr:ABC transporter permease [Gemmatimonadales bacterium]HYT84537.1 ABC transporter permease [Gemmatimonadales bacterium]
MRPFVEGVGIALASLRAHKVRAALTILGVAIGVMVVIVIWAVISGFNKGLSDMLASLGPKTFYVGRFWGGAQHEDSDDPNPWRRRPPLTIAEAERLEALPTIKFVVVDENGSGDVEYGGRRYSTVSIQGRDADWPKVAGGDIFPGRSFSHLEDAANSRVVVVNEKLAALLFGRDLEPVGRRIKIAKLPYEVIGVYNPPTGLFGEGDQAEAFIPYGTLIKYVPYFPGWLDFFVAPEDSVSVERAIDDVTVALRSMRGLRPRDRNNFDAVTQERYLQAVNSMTVMFKILMVSLSMAGLMVGGVGVVAIMMISVTERTREIGVRKALGATRRTILWQFLVEAATLTLVGGAIGLVVGGAIAYLVGALTPVPAYVPLMSVVIALAAAAVTGLLFGIYPASKAARLDPVEALRYE